MTAEFIKIYGQLSDCIITEINLQFDVRTNQKILKVGIYCANLELDFAYENLLICFSEIVSLDLKDNYEINTLSPKEVLILNKDETILFDFDPIDCFDFLEENMDSNFKILCKKMNYTRKS